MFRHTISLFSVVFSDECVSATSSLIDMFIISSFSHSALFGCSLSSSSGVS